MANYTRFTTAAYDFETAEEIVQELSEYEGFIGCNYYWVMDRVKVVAYYHTNGMGSPDLIKECPNVTGFSTIKKLPEVMLVWHEVLLKLPKGQTWPEFARALKNEPLRMKLNGYIDTWYPNLPDKIKVKYLGVN